MHVGCYGIMLVTTIAVYVCIRMSLDLIHLLAAVQDVAGMLLITAVVLLH